MNIVLFSDLHLDKNTHGRMKNHEYIRVQDAIDSLYDITEYCKKHDVNVVVSTGDQFDSSNVIPRYRKIFYKWVSSLTDIGIEVILLMGNHDLNKNKLADHAMMDLVLLSPKNVRVIEEPELIHFEDFDLACVPWNDNDIIPEFKLDRYTICAAHCSTFRGEGWDNEGSDFQIPLEYFTSNFDFSVLGHIHSFDILNNDPPVLYSGSVQSSHFSHYSELGFTHITDNGWEHIKYKLRPRETLYELPKQIDPETIYKLCYNDDQYTLRQIDNAFKGCFSLKIERTITKNDRVTRFENDMKDMSETEVLKTYFELEGVNYGDLEELWMEIYQE